MSSQPSDPIRASLTGDVYERLRVALLTGRYLPGQKLKITDLCEQVQGSLGAVREALARLLAEGLVQAEPYKGFHVAPVSPTDLIHLTQARIEVERLCLAASLAKGDIAWEGRLVALLHQLSRSSGLKPPAAAEEWARLHAAFHEALVAACDNGWLLRMHRVLSERSERYRRLAHALNVYPDVSNPRRTDRDIAAEHQDLAEAALARDSDRAGDLIAGHLQRTTDGLLARLRASALAEQAESSAPGGVIDLRARRALSRF